MPLDLRNLYSRMRETRRRYLDRAREVAELTLPWIAPTGMVIRDAPFTALGTQAVHSLSATVQRAMMPVNVQWFRYAVKEEALRQMAASGVNAEDINPQTIELIIDAAENVTKEYLIRTSVDSLSLAGLRRNLIEGNTLFMVTPDRLRVFPLRQFVVKREDTVPRFAITREELFPDDIEEFAKSMTSEPGDLPEHLEEPEQLHKSLMTLIDWKNDVIMQQAPGQESAVEVQGVDPVQYFIMVPSVPDVTDYTIGYAFEYFGLINELNALAESFGEISAAAAVNLQFVRPGGPTPKELESQRSGEWRVGNWEDLGNYQPGIDPSKAGTIITRMANLQIELQQAFAMGLKDRALNAKTATEVLRVVQELETQSQDVLTNFETTFLRPLLAGILFINGLTSIKAPESQRAFTIEITTGTNAIARETSFLRYLATAEQLMALDPSLRLNGVKAIQIAEEIPMLNVEGLLRAASPEELRLQAVQALAQAGIPTTGGNGAVAGPIGSDTRMTAGGPQSRSLQQAAQPQG